MSKDITFQIERILPCAHTCGTVAHVRVGHLRHFERPLGMSVMPPIATENGEALNARGKPRGTPARVLSFAASAQCSF